MRPLTKDEEMINDIIFGTIGELETATEAICDKIMVDRDTCLKAMQLLKAYNAMFGLTYEDYCREYD